MNYILARWDRLKPYHREAKMVFTGEGKFFKYEFD
jgi:hypothetical protein